MAKITEIAPNVYRFSIFWSEINLQFNYFLLQDDEPFLFTTGLRGHFPELREAVQKVIDLKRLRWIGFSHFESDECGALNQWLAAAPNAQPVASFTSCLVNLSDFADRPSRPMKTGDTLVTGQHRFRFCETPHLPHGWDAGVFFEENNRVLLCSDLFHHDGDVEATVETDLLGRVDEAMTRMQQSPMPDYSPWRPQTEQQMDQLAALDPRVLAVMHGSSFTGDGRQALLDLKSVMQKHFSGNTIPELGQKKAIA